MKESEDRRESPSSTADAIFERLGVTAREYYETAVAANRGIVTPAEQQRLQAATVAVAGLGGLGGACVTTLVRMGIGAFHLADFDTFSISNVHRQESAMSSTVGQSKVDAMRAVVQDIHPSCRVRCFDGGVTSDNIDEFLHGAAAVVDAIDLYCVPAHRMLHRRARELGKTVLMSVPMGFGGSLLAFGPTGMSFDRYFDFDDKLTPFDTMLRFVAGAVPSTFHNRYMDLGQASVADRRNVGIASSVRLCASLVATEVLALILQRYALPLAPAYSVFDPYPKRYLQGKLRWGNRGPLQRIKIELMRRRFLSQSEDVNRLW